MFSSLLVHFFISLLLFLRTNLALQTIFDSNLISSTCSSSSLLSVWNSGGSSVFCTDKAECSFNVLTSSPLTLTLDLSSLSLSPYSYLSFDLLVSSSQPSVDYSLGSGSINTLSNLLQSTIEDVCATINIFKASFTSLSSDIGSTLVINIANSNGALSNQFGLRALRIQANCAINCSTCYTATSCTICLNGFSRILTSSGEYFCESTINCQITGCFACLKDTFGVTFECTQCLPGYSLSSNSCIALNSCSSGQYRDSNDVCQFFSSECIQFDMNGNMNSCSSSIIISSYLCPINKAIVIYPYQNYEIYSCFCQVSNCLDCSTSSTICGSCSQGYYLQGSLCLACSDANCQTCTSSACSVCQTNYVLNSVNGVCEPCISGSYYSSGLCLSCSDSNCQTCTSSACSVCKTNYVLDSSGVCQQCPSSTYSSGNSCMSCSDANCQTCTSAACSDCKTNYVLNSTNGVCELCSSGFYYQSGSCLSCSDSNCHSCTSSACSICKTNYVLNSTNGICQPCPSSTYSSGNSCVNCYDPNCSVCTSTTCSACNAQYVLNQISGVCELCPFGTYYSSGSCVNCSVTHCQICTASTCQLCFSQYILNSTNGSCEPCPLGSYYSSGSCIRCSDFYCETCTSLACSWCKTNYVLNSTNGVCELCTQGTYYSSGTCLSCSDPNCKTCSSSSCSFCKTNYVLNSTSGVCELCPLGTYYSGGSCLNCKASNCEICPSSNCQACNTNYILNSTSGACDLCPSSTYSSGNVCLNCSDSNCNSCNFSACSVCSPSTYQSGSSCLNCSDSNCKTCNSSSCQVCKVNYVLNSTSGVCELCPSGTYPSGNSCLNCSDSNCQTCTQAACSICNTNYVLNSINGVCEFCIFGSNDLDNSCLNCSDSNCQICSSSSACSVCKKRYVLNSTSGACELCPSGTYYSGGSCLNCSDSNCKTCNSSTCSVCKTDYVQNSSGICQLCPSGTYYSGGACLNCSDSNCTTCDSSTCSVCKTNYFFNSTSGACEHCPSGTYYSSGTCLNCSDSNCKTCTSSYCSICKTNYVLYSNGICTLCPSNTYYSSGTCQNCSVSFCKTCTSSACSACNTNYVLNSTSGICEHCPSGTYYSSGTCLNCSDSNCKTCTSLACSVCSTNYVLYTNGICQYCSSGTYYSAGSCTACSDSHCHTCTSSACSVCKTNYILNSASGICDPCPSGTYSSGNSCLNCSDTNCQTCTSSDCSVCKTNYVLNSASGICDPCPSGTHSSGNSCLNCQDSNCQTCTSTACSVCKPNYVLNGTCQLCPSSTYKSNNSCLNCSDPNCSSCTSSSCSVCKNQYVLNGSSCALCPSEKYYASGNCISCSDSNCLTCPNNLCTSCKSNYYFNGSSTCVTCSGGYYLSGASCLPCSDSNCLNCTSASCNTCKTNYSINPSNGICAQTNCFAKQYFNSLSYSCQNCPNGCDQCTSSACLICSYSAYYYVDPSNPLSCIRSKSIFSSLPLCNNFNNLTIDQVNNYFTVKQKVQDSGYLIVLTFQNKLVSSSGVVQLIIVDSDIESQTSSAQDNTVNITVIMKSSCKQKLAIISFQNNEYYQSNGMAQNNTSIDLQSYVKLSSEQQATSSTVGTVGSAVSTAIISSILPIAILSNFYVLVNTIDLTGFLYYLLFINIRFPQNVLSFFDLFKNFQFPFIPNVFQFLTNPNYTQQAPQRFMDMQNDAYFLNCAGQSLTIIGGFLTVYVTIKLFSYVPIKITQNYLRGAIFRTWEYGAFFDALGSVYIYILTGAYLQFTVYEFDDSMYVLNYILHAIWSLISFGIPFFFMWILYREKNMKSNEKAKRQLSSLIGGINLYNSSVFPNLQEKQDSFFKSAKMEQVELKKEEEEETTKKNQSLPLQQPSQQLIDPIIPQNSQVILDPTEIKLSRRKWITIKTSHLCNGLLYLRKLFFSMIIVYLYNHQYWQLTLISLLNVAVTCYIFYVRPYETPSENFKNGTGEIILIIIQITLSTLVEDHEEESEDNRFIQGWIVVSLSAFIILWNTILILIDAIKSLLLLFYKILKMTFTTLLKSFKRNSRVIPQENKKEIPSHDRHQENKQIEIQINPAIEEKEEFFSSPNQNITPSMISSNLLYPNKNKDSPTQPSSASLSNSVHGLSISQSPQLHPRLGNNIFQRSIFYPQNQLEVKMSNTEKGQSQRDYIEEEKNQQQDLEDDSDKNQKDSQRKNSSDEEEKKMLESLSTNLNIKTNEQKIPSLFVINQDLNNSQLKGKQRKYKKSLSIKTPKLQITKSS